MACGVTCESLGCGSTRSVSLSLTSAIVEGTDVPDADATSCSMQLELLATPSNATKPIVMDVAMACCSPIEVVAVVPCISGSDKRLLMQARSTLCSIHHVRFVDEVYAPRPCQLHDRLMLKVRSGWDCVNEGSSAYPSCFFGFVAVGFNQRRFRKSTPSHSISVGAMK